MNFDFTGKSILVADDSKAICEFIKLHLDKMKFSNVFVCGDGEKAIDIAEKNNIDFALIDLRMPRKNGLDVLESLGDTISIIISGINSKMAIEQSVTRGASYFLLKPFNKTEFYSIIEKVFIDGYDLKEHIFGLEKIEKSSTEVFTKRIFAEANPFDYVKNIGEMIFKLKSEPQNTTIIEMLKDNIDTLIDILDTYDEISKLLLIRDKIEIYEKGIIEPSDSFFEECLYILNDVRKGVKL